MKTYGAIFRAARTNAGFGFAGAAHAPNRGRALKNPIRARPSCCEGRWSRGRARRTHRKSRHVTDPQRSDRDAEVTGRRRKGTISLRHIPPPPPPPTSLPGRRHNTASSSHGRCTRYGIPFHVVPAASKRRGFFLTTPGSSLAQALVGRGKTGGKDPESRGP